MEDIRTTLLMLGLTENQYAMMLSADQNGHFTVLKEDEADANHLIAEGIFCLRGNRVTAHLTPKATSFIAAREAELRKRKGE